MTRNAADPEKALMRRVFLRIGLLYILLFVPVVGYDLWSGRAQISQSRGKPNLIYDRDREPAAYWSAVRQTATWGFGGGLGLIALGQLIYGVNRQRLLVLLKVWNAGRTTCRQKGPSRLVLGGFPWVPVAVFSLLTVAAGRTALNASRFDLWNLATSGLMAALIALGLAQIAERTRFVFDRERGVCRWSRVGGYGIRWGTLPLADVREVAVETLGPSGPDQRVSRLTLRTPRGEIPVRTSYQWGVNEDLARIAERIGRFLANHGEEDPSTPPSDKR